MMPYEPTLLHVALLSYTYTIGTSLITLTNRKLNYDQEMNDIKKIFSPILRYESGNGPRSYILTNQAAESSVLRYSLAH